MSAPAEYKFMLMGDCWIDLNDKTLRALFAAHDALADDEYPEAETTAINDKIDQRFRELKELSVIRKLTRRHYGEPVMFGGLPAFFAEFPFGRAVHIPSEHDDGQWLDGTAPVFRPIAALLVLRCTICHRQTEFPVVRGGMTLTFPCAVLNLTLTVGRPERNPAQSQAEDLSYVAVCSDCSGRTVRFAHDVFIGSDPSWRGK